MKDSTLGLTLVLIFTCAITIVTPSMVVAYLQLRDASKRTEVKEDSPRGTEIKPLDKHNSEEGSGQAVQLPTSEQKEGQPGCYQ